MSALKLVISLWLLVIGIFIFATPSFATVATPSANISTSSSQIASPIPYLPSYTQPLPYAPPNSPQGANQFLFNIMHALSCFGAGQSIIGESCIEYQIQKDLQGKVQTVPVLSSVNTSGGLLGATGGIIGALYTNRPLNTVDYLASVGQSLGIVKEANAQVPGSGTSVLSPILKLWEVSRNIAYLVMILIFLVVGLMIMFRSRLNPQTVINIQAALPGLVIGLILITFSYFMAALISDMAFVGTNIVGAYFSAVRGEAANPQNLVEDLSSRSVISIFTPFTRPFGFYEMWDVLDSFWEDLKDPKISDTDLFAYDPSRVIKYLLLFMIWQVFSPLGSAFGGTGSVVVGLGSFVITNVFTLQLISFGLGFLTMIILVYTMFRLALRLINSFLTIIFLTVTAPFQFLFASLPGRQGVVTDWILNMLANVLAFPAVIAVFYFVAFLLGPSFGPKWCDRPASGGNPAQPCPFKVTELNQSEYNNLVSTAYAQIDPTGTKIVGNQAFPLFGGLNLNFVQFLLAFGALMALPTVPDIISRTVGKIGEAGQLIGQEVGGSTAAGQRYYGQISGGIPSVFGQAGRITNAPGYEIGKVNGQDVVIPTYGPGQGAQFGTFYKGWSTLSRWSRGRIKPPKSPI